MFLQLARAADFDLSFSVFAIVSGQGSVGSSGLSGLNGAGRFGHPRLARGGFLASAALKLSSQTSPRSEEIELASIATGHGSFLFPTQPCVIPSVLNLARKSMT